MEMIGSSFAPHPVAATVTAKVPQIAVADDHGVSFDDLLDIVNPLQHLPVVGTLYRALTHDSIKTPEKIIGDTIFGGMMGFISSVADTAFEQITGKSFGDTVLSFLIGDHGATGTEVAKATAPRAPAPAPTPTAQAPAPAKTPAPMTTAAVDAAAAPEQALALSLTARGIDPALQQRALFAYRRATSSLAN